jgi:general nucleoside transport system permease protein
MKATILGRIAFTIVGLLGAVAITLVVFGIPVADGIRLLAEGAFGDRFGWSRTLVKMTPLLLTGLGMVVAWRAGMYNIGGEGQFLVGSLLGAMLARVALVSNLPLPPALVLIGILILSMVGGALWAALAGWLYIKRGIDVVISTILLNFVALHALSYMVSGPIRQRSDNVPLSDLLPREMMLPRLDRQMDLHAGVLLALLMAVLVYVYLYKMRAGFRVRLSGESARVARANLIDASKTKLQAMLISGALCGLAGGIEYAGISRQLGTSFAQGWGFLGIPVALVAGLQPLLTIPSAFFFGALFAGSENLSRFTQAGPTLVYVVQAVAVLGFVALRALANRRAVQRGAELPGGVEGNL